MPTGINASIMSRIVKKCKKVCLKFNSALDVEGVLLTTFFMCKIAFNSIKAYNDHSIIKSM